MGARGSGALVLDAGALIAIERGNAMLNALILEASSVHVPAGALAQAWRNPRRQVRLVRAMRSRETTIHPLDTDVAKAAGTLCAATGTDDIIDATVAQLGREVSGLVATSDPDDIRRLDPNLRVVAI